MPNAIVSSQPGPTLAVVVPCYNAAPFLAALMESIRAQTEHCDQVILCDDLSTDGSLTVASQFPEVRVIANARRLGPSASRNTGWRASTATWVHFHDADDLMDPRFMELTLQKAQTSGADVVLVDGQEFRDGGPLQTGAVIDNSHPATAPEPLVACLQRGVGGTFGLYRRQALEAVQGFDEALLGGEDPDLHVRLAAGGARFAHVPQVLVHRRIHANNYSYRQPEEGYRGAIKSGRRYFDLLPSNTHPVVAASVAAVARELDRLGATGDAQEGWDLLASRELKVFPTNSPVLKAGALVLPPGVLSGLASGRLRTAATRLVRHAWRAVRHR